MVQYSGPGSHSVDLQHMEFLWVWWYGWDLDHAGGWKVKHLHHIWFVDGNNLAAFGFVDPGEVIHNVHLIPAFAHGQTTDLLPPSLMACMQSNKDEDWQHFYILM